MPKSKVYGLSIRERISRGEIDSKSAKSFATKASAQTRRKWDALVQPKCLANFGFGRFRIACFVRATGADSK